MCHNMGAKVIMFKNYGKYIDFKNNYALKVIGYNENFWIGAEATTPKDFYWYDDNQRLEGWIWGKDEPNNAQFNEYCVYGRQSPLFIADDICYKPLNTICEYSD